MPVAQAVASLRQDAAAQRFQRLAPLAELDDLVYQNREYFEYDRTTADALVGRLLVEAFRHHYRNNITYQRYCDRMGVAADSIAAPADVDRIPLIPSTMFKRTPVVSVPDDEVVKVCTSSGTTGSISRVYRDEPTLSRFVGGMQGSIDMLFQIDDAYCVNLGPDTAEAGDLWFSYVISLVDMIFTTEHVVRDGRFSPEDALEAIRENRADHESLVIIGAPVMLLELLEHMERNDVVLPDGKEVFVITAGGWKRHQGDAVDRPELVRGIHRHIEGFRDDHYRDVFNMVELNSILAECEAGVKHVPVWVRARVLDPRTLAPTPPGELGLLALLDASSTSYPAFVLTDDYARQVLHGTCACGRNGVGLEFVRRVASKDSRGCALKLDRAYAGGAAR